LPFDARKAFRLSIGSRWVLRYTAATTLLLVLLTTLIYHRIQGLVLDGIDDELRKHTRGINETIARENNLEAVGRLLETEIASTPPERQLAVELYDRDFQLLLQVDILSPFSAPLEPWTPSGASDVRTYRESRDSRHPYFVRVEQNALGFTRVSIHGGPDLRELDAIRDVIAWVLAVGVTLTGFIGWWLARQTLRPIAEITATAQLVSSAGNEGWLPTHGTGDELDELAQTLNRMLERIRLSADRMRRFAAQAAHELLTPLGVARTRIEVALVEDQTKELHTETLAAVLGDIERLGQSVNAVLDIARSGAGLDPDRVEEIDLSELLHSLAEFYRPLAEDKGLEFPSPEPLDCSVLGDRGWLHQLFTNLIDNAIKFSAEGGAVRLTISQTPGFVRVSLSDSGAGIAAQDRPKIFDRFYRGDGAQTPGQGLGLALALEIARAHGGAIEYEAPPAGGSIFHVQLPTGSRADGPPGEP